MPYTGTGSLWKEELSLYPCITKLALFMAMGSIHLLRKAASFLGV
jgi:hypothetical protein